MRMWKTVELHSSHVQEELAESLFTWGIVNMDVMMLAQIIMITATKRKYMSLAKLGIVSNTGGKEEGRSENEVSLMMMCEPVWLKSIDRIFELEDLDLLH